MKLLSLFIFLFSLNAFSAGIEFNSNGVIIVPAVDPKAKGYPMIGINDNDEYEAVKIGSGGGMSISGKQLVGRALLEYGSTNVTTGGWVELVASLADSVSVVEIFDSSGQILELGTGAAASEVPSAYVMRGGNGFMPLSLASGARVAIQAVSATASSGEIIINFYK